MQELRKSQNQDLRADQTWGMNSRKMDSNPGDISGFRSPYAVRTLPTARLMCSTYTANSMVQVQYEHCQQHAPCAVCTLPIAARFTCRMYTANSTLHVQYAHCKQHSSCALCALLTARFMSSK